MTPTLERPTSGDQPIVSLYPCAVFWRLMEGWAEYESTHRRPRQSFAEGGSISHRVIATEGAFVGGAVDYAMLKEARRLVQAFSTDQGLALALYWEDGLRSIRLVAFEMHRDIHAVRDLMWWGTERMVMQLCGLDPRSAHAECRLYRQKLPMKKVGIRRA